MSNLSDCCTPCPSVLAVNVPGTPGLSGYTITTANFVLPAANANVTITVASTAWMVDKLTLVIGDSNSNYGTFSVVSVNSPTSVTLKWLDLSSDSATGTTISSPATVVASGIAGLAGLNAFSVVTSGSFTVPSKNGQTTTLTVNSNAWMQVGMNVFITGPANFQVYSLTGTTQVVLTFLGYTGDVSPGATLGGIPAAVISPAGIQGVSALGYGLLNVQTLFYGTTAYIPVSSAVKAIYVECIGAGGSGGGAILSGAGAAAFGSGGGGGCYSAVYLTNNTPGVGNIGSTYNTGGYAIQIGAGAAAGAPAANGNGNLNTQSTIFASPNSATIFCAALGGYGGTAGAAAGSTASIIAGGSGGNNSGSTYLTFDGINGSNSIRLSGTVGISGSGGSGPFGGGPSGSTTAGAGVAGGQWGAGGSGGATIDTAGVSGGAGCNGMMRVWEFG